MSIAELYRRDYSRLLASLIRHLGDFELAEDVLQDAFAQALTSWEAQGVPKHPQAWLIRVARNAAVDQLRRRKRFDEKMAALEHFERSLRSEAPIGHEHDAFGDDLLRLFFTCCHPALSTEAQVALTLKTVGGLTTEEVAHAFLVPTTTMAQRLVRAKRKISAAAIPYRVPDVDALPARLKAVLAVLYLIFNEGFTPTHSAQAAREELCEEAIRLTRMLAELLPTSTAESLSETNGLLALMLLNHARAPARVTTDRCRVLLQDQDRSLWHTEAMNEGRDLVRTALSKGFVGPYLVQAAIAAVHSEAVTSDQTDWRQIAGLYEVLIRLVPNPIIELNRAVAIAMVDGPERGLRLLDTLHASGALAHYHWLPAARADLLGQVGRDEEAIVEYARAEKLAGNPQDVEFLRRKRASLLRH